MNISFRYLGEELHFISKNKQVENKFIFFLNINQFKVIDEKNGYDRLVEFNFFGELISEENKMKEFSFKIIVFAIHDLNNKNKDIVKYLFNRLFIN